MSGRPLGPRKHYRPTAYRAGYFDRLHVRRRCITCSYLVRPENEFDRALMETLFDQTGYLCVRRPRMLIQEWKTDERTCDGWKKKEEEQG